MEPELLTRAACANCNCGPIEQIDCAQTQLYLMLPDSPEKERAIAALRDATFWADCAPKSPLDAG